MANASVETDLSNGLYTIALNRPEAANGFNHELADGLYEAAIEADQNPDIRAVVLTGRGKFFSAGGDVKLFANAGDDVGRELHRLTSRIHGSASLFHRTDAPVIVAVNGLAAGGGFSLSLAGDLVLAAESASFLMAYTTVGLSIDGTSSYFLPRVLGLRRAQELLFTNRKLSAAEALEWGLVTRVVPDDELMNEATELGRMLVAGPARCHGVCKRLLAETYGNQIETQAALESRGIAETSRGPEGQEGLAAFKAKRKPNFDAPGTA